VFRKGETCDRYYIILQGEVRVFTCSASGREVLLYHLRPGGVCVLTASCLMGGSDFPAEVIAETNLWVAVVGKQQFNELLENSADFRSFIMAGFGERIAGLVATIQRLALEPIEQRLAKYLCAQKDNLLLTTHQHIAEEIGSAREVVSRQLKKFEHDHLVRLSRGAVEIIDRSALKQLI